LVNSAPEYVELRAWLDANLPGVPPGTLTGKALNYLNNEWPKLVRYLEDGRLEIDNNLAENAIRPFVIGRKNWLFSDSVHGVKASANLYSLVESAKANGLEPYQYLRQVFTVLPQAEMVEAIESLLPWAVKKIPAETRYATPRFTHRLRRSVASFRNRTPNQGRTPPYQIGPFGVRN